MVQSMNENSEKVLQEEDEESILKKAGVNDSTKTMVCLTCKHCQKTENGYRCKEKNMPVNQNNYCGVWEEDVSENQEEILKKKETEEKKEKLRYEFIELSTGKEKDWGRATELLSNYITKNYNIFTTKNDQRNEVWIYDEGIYKPEGKSYIKEMLREILQERYNIWIFNQVMAKVEPDTYIDEEEFFKQNCVTEVPVQNGILDIMKKELKPFDPDKIFFNKLNARWDENADCPKIEQFFKDVVKDEEDIKLIYEIIGFCLLKEYRFEKAFMFLGDGRNGKDKTLELIRRLLSPDNCASVDLHRLEGDDWATYELFNKMVNIAGEISSQDLKNVSKFKALTGRSFVPGKRKYLSTINFENYAKFVFACNELPMVYENTRAFWDRWETLHFPYTFVKKEEFEKAEDKTKLKIRDENIIEKIATPEEFAGLLKKSVEGLHRLLKNKEFSATKGSQETKDFWVRKANSFLAFCMDCLEESVDNFISKKELRRAYKKYYKKHKVRGASDKMIKATLQDEFGVIDEYKTIHEGTENLGGRQVHVWEGITWKK